MIVMESSWIQNRGVYLVFTVVASEPDLSKVQQQHLLLACRSFYTVSHFFVRIHEYSPFCNFVAV